MKVIFDTNPSRKRDRTPELIEIEIEKTHETTGKSIDYWRAISPERKCWTIIKLVD